jgi:hypothetical protein
MNFCRLQDIQVALVEPRIITTNSSVETILLLSGDVATGQFIPSHEHEARELEDRIATIEQLTAFKSAVEQYGLTRSLLAFADHDKTLSSAIAAVPALETLKADRSVRNSTDVVSAVEASIMDAITVFLRKLRARAKNILLRLSGKAERLDAIKLHIKTLSEMIGEGRVLDQTKFKTKQYYLLNKHDLFEAFQDVERAEAFATHIAKAPLPGTEAAFHDWSAKLDADFRKVFGTKMTMPDEIAAHARKDTLAGHGYGGLDDFGLIEAAFERIHKSKSVWVDTINVVNRRIQHTADDPTMLYLHKSSVAALDVIWTFACFTYWVADDAANNVMKALFDCSEKK